MAKTKQEVKTKRKRIVKPKQEQIMDGLNVSFDDAMRFLSNPKADKK